MILSPVTIAWVAVASTCVIGVTAIGSLSEPRIAAQAALNDQLLAKLDSDQNVIRNREAMIDLRRRLHDELDRRNAADHGIPTSRYLRDAAVVVQRHRTVITDVTDVVAPRGLAAPAEPFVETPIILTLEGPYLEMLTVIRLLADQRIPATIDVRSIVRTEQTRNVVTAVLRVDLQQVVRAGS